MSPYQRISSFTPSNTDPEILERIFVQRERMLRKLVKRLERGIAKGDKHHILLVGPRGSGKTHFITLVQHRLLQNTHLMDKVRIAWLGEDTVYTGLIDLALEVSGQLADAYPTEFNQDVRSSARSLPPNAAAEAILKDIIRQLGQCTLLILMENLDRAFGGLGDTGQKKWRAFLQETGKITTLATSQQLFDSVSERDEAFFGFFDIQHLEALSTSDAIRLIANVAHEYGNQELVTFLGTHEGKYRVRALRHLAGGNHRMYILLSEFVTKESLDDLVAAFEQLAEELTPYFQERIQSLPPQQARIVQCLCNAHGAMTVKLVAETTFIPERNCSKQLGELKKKYYVTSTKRGKESYYEMAEPIMRLCLEVKNQRGRPLRLIAMFLRAWFPAESLQVKGGKATTRTGQYCAYALEMDNTFLKEIRQELDREIEGKLGSQKFDDALALAKELACSDPAYGLFREAYIGSCSGQTDVMLVNLTKLIELSSAPADLRGTALLNRGNTYRKQGDVAEALADYTTLIDMVDVRSHLSAIALLNRGYTYEGQGDVAQALADYTFLIEMSDAPSEQRAMALFNRGSIYGRQEDIAKELSDYTALIKMSDAPVDSRAKALLDRGGIYGKQEDIAKALADYTALIGMSDAQVYLRAAALVNRGALYWMKEDFEQSFSDFRTVIENADFPKLIRKEVLFYLPESMIPIRSRSEAMEALVRAFEAGDPAADYYGGTPHDLLQVVLMQGHSSWSDYISELVSIYGKYKACGKLGNGLTRAIEQLDTGEYSEAQLEIWNEAWQEAGKGIEEIEIPLQSLDCAIQAIQTKSDRPLFALPLEIRKLVIPLLHRTLGSHIDDRQTNN